MWLLGLLFFLMASLCATEKILVLSPVAIKSHDILNHALVNVLLEGGYEVISTDFSCKLLYSVL